MPERHNEDFWEYLDRLVDASEVVIDRPKGSSHPEHADMVYPLDYGYLAGTTSSDGAGIDVWVGSAGIKHQAAAVLCTVDLIKRDTEIKILMGCTEDEMVTVANFINESSMGCMLLQRR